MEVTTVLEKGLDGTSGGLWYSPNRSGGSSGIYPTYVFGTQAIDFVSNDGDNWTVTFNAPLNNLNKSALVEFATYEWDVFFCNQGTGGNYFDVVAQGDTSNPVSFGGNGAGTYIVRIKYVYTDNYSNSVYIQICSFINVDGDGNIIKRINLSGLNPSSMNSSNLVEVTIVSDYFNCTAPTFTWWVLQTSALTVFQIGSGDSLSYIVPQTVPDFMFAKAYLVPSEWPDVYLNNTNPFGVGVGGLGVLQFRAIPD
jgi:hypothetical protein